MAVWAVAAGMLAGTPAAVAQDTSVAQHESVQDFLQRTMASSEDLDAIARTILPLQVPLLADALADAGEAGAPASERVYQALVRWQYWLSSKLDPTNRGFWSHQPPWSGDARRATGRVSPGLAALELLQLRALARLAHQRGHAFDALVWWREHSSLGQRLAGELYDPARGAYVALDSTGHRLDEDPGLTALLPLAFGAPVVLDRARRLTWELLTGRPQPPADDLDARVRAMQALDPLNGWLDRPGARWSDPQTTVDLLHVAVSRLQDEELLSLLEKSLAGLDLAPRGVILLRMGSHQVPLPLPRSGLEPWVRARVALDFLERIELVERQEARRALEQIDRARASEDPFSAVSDSVAGMLTQALGRWRRLDLDAARARVRPGEPEPQPLNGDGASPAFRFVPTDTRHWIDEALRRVAEDVLAFHLRSWPSAHVLAELEPHALPRGSAPVLRIRGRGGLSVPEDAEGWTGAWTTGRMVEAPFPIEPKAQGQGELSATLPRPPDQLGLWWLILNGPAGRPLAAPGVGLVEPFLASVETRSVQLDGTTRFTVRVESRIGGELRGRFELSHPVDFKLEPASDGVFVLGPGETRTWDLALVPTVDVGPGIYPIEWRFYESSAIEKRLAGELAVPFRWLRIGPFLAPTPDALETHFPPEGPVDLLAGYADGGRSLNWEPLPVSALRDGGFVFPQEATAPLAASRRSDPELGDGGGPFGVWYLLTAFSTASEEITVTLESPQAASVRLNGREVTRCEGFRQRVSVESRLVPGTNYLLMKVAAAAGSEPRVRVALKDVSGEPLREVNNDLEQLLAQVAGLTAEMDPLTAHVKHERRAMRQVSFTYFDPDAKSVAIVGTFNGWSPTDSPMVDLGGGRWQGEVRLRPGRFEYKFAIDGETWVADPENPLAVSDGFGGHNSVIVVE